MYLQSDGCHVCVNLSPQPENFLLTDTGPDAKLKAADFGLSSFFTVRGIAAFWGWVLT